MRDIYVKTKTGAMSAAVISTVAAPGLHARGKLQGFSVCRILDVPERVSEHLALFTFNSCASVIGHTVRWEDLHKGQHVLGEGRAWDPADPAWALS